MANSHITSFRGRAQRRGLPWMSERQIDAYLQARETLRRVGASARPPASAAPSAAPPSRA